MSENTKPDHYVEDTLRYRVRFWISERISRRHQGVCWVQLYQWARGDIRWREISWHCDDAQRTANEQGQCWQGCWCGKQGPALPIVEPPAPA